MQIALFEPLGVETVLYIKAGEQTLVSTMPGMTRFKIGDPLRFKINRQRLHYFGRDGVRLQ